MRLFVGCNLVPRSCLDTVPGDNHLQFGYRASSVAKPSRDQAPRCTTAGLWLFVQRRFRRGHRYGIGFTLALLAVAGALWGFLEIIDAVADQEALYHLDFLVRRVLEIIVTPERTEWVVRITNVGGVPFTTGLVVAFALLLLFRRRWWSLVQLVFTTADGSLLIVALKALFHRARPVEKLVPAAGYSFPSGHAFIAMSFYGVLVYLVWRTAWPLAVRVLAALFGTVMILLIGASRVYLGVHWLTDVLGGFSAGLIWLIASILIVRTAEHRRSLRKNVQVGGQ